MSVTCTDRRDVDVMLVRLEQALLLTGDRAGEWFARACPFPDPTLAHFALWMSGYGLGHRHGREQGENSAYRDIAAPGRPTARQVAKREKARRRR